MSDSEDYGMGKGLLPLKNPKSIATTGIPLDLIKDLVGSDISELIAQRLRETNRSPDFGRAIKLPDINPLSTTLDSLTYRERTPFDEDNELIAKEYTDVNRSLAFDRATFPDMNTIFKKEYFEGDNTSKKIEWTSFFASNLIRNYLSSIDESEAINICNEIQFEVNTNKSAHDEYPEYVELLKPLIDRMSEPYDRNGGGQPNYFLEYSRAQVASLLNCADNTVKNWLEKNKLVGYQKGGQNGDYKFPAWQFQDNMILVGLDTVLDALDANGVPAMRAITLPLAEFKGNSMLKALESGDIELAEKMAIYYKNQ